MPRSETLPRSVTRLLKGFRPCFSRRGLDTFTVAKELQRLRDHYDTHDAGDEMADGEWEGPGPDPMVTTSLRLPKSVLDQVRAQARQLGVRPTSLIRRWVEAQVFGTEDQYVTRGELRRELARLQQRKG